MVAARSLGPLHRVQSLSLDGGINFEQMKSTNLPQPTSGVEGSILFDEENNRLLLSTLNDGNFLGLRYNLTLFELRLSNTTNPSSSDWKSLMVINSGPSAYSALTKLKDGKIGILYERSNTLNRIFKPDYISWRILYQ